MEYLDTKAVKKAKKGILSVVFGRTALILALLLLQIGVMISMVTVLKDYRTYMDVVLMILRVIVVIYVINEKGNPAFTMTWILLMMVFPVFGTLFYIYVKSELGSRALAKQLSRRKLETHRYMQQDQSVIRDLKLSKSADVSLAHYMKYQLGFPIYRNTKVTYFPSGDKKFHQMVWELQKAEKFIFLEYFIVEEGYMWNTILEILKAKVREGVEVRFMYDGMCSISKLPYDYPRQMRKYGIRCKMFSPIRPVLTTVQNNRDHRKICVVDGKVAFTGGVNLADEYINRIERFGYWKDTAAMFEGDAVQSFTIMFLQMWNATERGGESYQDYLTEKSTGVKKRELGYVLPYADSPFDHEDVGETVYKHILNHAKRYVHIMTPYLILDDQMMDTLTKTAKSGIEVAIIMPHIPDKWYAFALAKTYYQELLEAGVKIYEFTPGFVHAKIFVSDDEVATVGTINLDYRSLYLHFENGAYIYNNPAVRDIEQDFQRTIRKCHCVTLEEVRKQNIWMQICGRALRLIAPLM